MQPSERKSLYRFMAIYLLSMLLLFAVASAVFYRYELSSDLTNQKRSLKQHSQKISEFVNFLGKKSIKDLKDIDIAFWGRKQQYAFGTFRPEDVDMTDHFELRDGYLYYFGFVPPPRARHIMFMVSRKVYDNTTKVKIIKLLIYSFVLFFIFIALVGYYLGKLFIRPMKDALEKMDMFVQDTTHELNTPISTILSNAEMMKLAGKCADSKELERIEIASRTLSRIYDDLSYLKLQNSEEQKAEKLDISQILDERLSYFAPLMDAKKISLHTEMSPNIIKTISRSDLTRLFDNLISNAIKYNSIGGEIFVQQDDYCFSIRDTGRGMSPKIKERVFERFARGDSSEGGFGLGLNIVYQICQKNGFKIDIESAENEGTTVELRFEI